MPCENLSMYASACVGPPWRRSVLRRLTVPLGGEDALIHARRPRDVYHMRPNRTVPHRGDGRAPVVPGLALPDVERGHFMHRSILRLSHDGLKASGPDVAWNTLAQGQPLVVIGVVELSFQLRWDGHPSDQEDRRHLCLRRLRRHVLRINAPIQIPDVCRANDTRRHALGPGRGVAQPALPGLRRPGVRRRQFITRQIFGLTSYRLVPGGVQDTWNRQPFWDVLFIVPAVEFLLVLGGYITIHHEQTVAFFRCHGLPPYVLFASHNCGHYQSPYTRCDADGEATVSPAPRKRSRAASTTGSISVGACPTPTTATNSPCGRTSTIRRACASERTSLSMPHTTRVGHCRRWSAGHNAGRSGGPCCTRCWMYAGSSFQTQRPSACCRSTPMASSRWSSSLRPATMGDTLRR